MTREPWTCPKCGRSLRVRNQEHVCGRYNLKTHFDGKDTVGEATYEWLCLQFEPFGEYDIVPMKTTIAFIRGANIAFLSTRRKGAEVSFVLDGTLVSPRIAGLTPYGRASNVFRIRIESESDLDEELADWIKRAQTERELKQLGG